MEEATKKFWHETDNEERKKLRDKTWQYVVDNYKQPDWCNYPEALAGDMGCWALVYSTYDDEALFLACKACEYCIDYVNK